MEVISNPKEQLYVRTVENKVYKFQGTDYKKDWVYVKRYQKRNIQEI
ncbi:hypothetical protein LPB87_17975 [Flavobacterium sp. EDS]|nr:hypothetical protein [Flavobacterium sp. EDS]MCD0476283.1 hypothetical protein [Flavobacterium sp. EDS]